MAVTAPLVNSSSTVTRVATHFAIGSVSEVTSGTISRFAGGMINTGDVGESLRQAFDPKSMLFDAALGGAVNSVQGINKPQQSFADLMSPEDAARYNQYWDDVAHAIDTDTRVRLNQWDYRPDAELYLQYQDVYDNPKFFDPQTGEVHYPGTNGDINTDGFTNGVYHVETLTSGTIIDRYGSNGSGRYFLRTEPLMLESIAAIYGNGNLLWSPII